MNWLKRTSAIRVAFITDTAFQREDSAKAGAMKRRALRVVSAKTRAFCIEDSTNPDIIFMVYRLPGSKSWCLRRRVYNA